MATLQSISKHVEEQSVEQDVDVRLPVTELDTTIQEVKQYPVNGKTSSTAAETINEISKVGDNIVKASYDRKKLNLIKSGSVYKETGPKPPLTRKFYSDPGPSGQKNVTFSNLGFEPDVDPSRKGNTDVHHSSRRFSDIDHTSKQFADVDTNNMRFADIVGMIINDQLKEDIHPYGRGNLYHSALGEGHKVVDHHDSGKLFMWLIASLVIMGIVGAAIVMSIMYQPEYMDQGISNTTTSPPS